jgi:predicted DNA-binding transcriptional regulator YafY
MSNPATRLITLISLLQRCPNQKAADLAVELDISVRSLHRYFAKLDEMGIPIYSERGPGGGFSLVRGYKLPPLVFSPDEAVALALGASIVAEMWGSLYQSACTAALAKLHNVLPDEQRTQVARAQRTLLATGMNRADMDEITPALEKLRTAVSERRRVCMVYHSGSHPEPQPREIDPYALVHRWGWWYVIGYCHLRDEIRSFRVDRILSLDLTRTVFQTPPAFDASAFLREEGSQQPLTTVQIRFKPRGAYIARVNRSYFETLEDQPDGSVVGCFRVPDLNWAASTVLAYGPDVEVLEPANLRRLVRDWAQCIIEQYSSDQGDENAQAGSQE